MWELAAQGERVVGYKIYGFGFNGMDGIKSG